PAWVTSADARWAPAGGRCKNRKPRLWTWPNASADGRGLAAARAARHPAPDGAEKKGPRITRTAFTLLAVAMRDSPRGGMLQLATGPWNSGTGKASTEKELRTRLGGAGGLVRRL